MTERDPLETRLERLAPHVDYPATPDFRPGVRARLGREPRPRARTWLALAAAALLVLLTAVALTPPARDVVAGWLHIRGVAVERRVELPSPTPRPTDDVAASLVLGERVSQADAEARAGYHVLVPGRLGEPDRIYFLNQYRRPPDQVSLVYFERPGIPATSQTGVAVLVIEFKADVERDVLDKLVGPGTTLQTVEVQGVDGVWIAGEPHALYFKSGNDQVMDSLRLATNTLLWSREGITYRIEAKISRQEALAIAASMR